MAAAFRIFSAAGSIGATAGAVEGWRSTSHDIVTARLGSAASLGFLWGSVWLPVLHDLPPRDMWAPFKMAREMVFWRPRRLTPEASPMDQQSAEMTVTTTIPPSQDYVHEAICQYIAFLAERTLVAFSYDIPYLLAGTGKYEHGGVAITVTEVARHLQSSVSVVLKGTKENVLALVHRASCHYVSYPHLLHPAKVMEFRFDGGWLPTQFFPSVPFDPAAYPPRTARQIQRFLKVIDTGRVLGIYGASGSGRKRLVRSLALTMRTHLKVLDRLTLPENMRRMVDHMPRASLLIEDFDDIADDATVQLHLSRFKRMFLNQPGLTLFVICKKAEALRAFPTFDQVRLESHQIETADAAKHERRFADARAAEHFFEPLVGKSIPQHVLNNFMHQEFDAKDVKDSQRRLEKACSAWADTGNTMYA